MLTSNGLFIFFHLRLAAPLSDDQKFEVEVEHRLLNEWPEIKRKTYRANQELVSRIRNNSGDLGIYDAVVKRERHKTTMSLVIRRKIIVLRAFKHTFLRYSAQQVWGLTTTRTHKCASFVPCFFLWNRSYQFLFRILRPQQKKNGLTISRFEEEQSRFLAAAISFVSLD